MNHTFGNMCFTLWISIKIQSTFTKPWWSTYFFSLLALSFSRQPHPGVQFVYFVFPAMIWCDHSFLPPLTQVCVLAKVRCPLCVPALGCSCAPWDFQHNGQFALLLQRVLWGNAGKSALVQSEVTHALITFACCSSDWHWVLNQQWHLGWEQTWTV